MNLAAVFLAFFAVTAKVPYREVVFSGMSMTPAKAHLTLALDEASFEKVWRTFAGKSAYPPIDFKTEAAVIITIGEKPTSGYKIDVKSVTKSKGVLVVDAVIARPAKGAMTAQVITSPYLVIAVPKDGIKSARWKNPPK